MHPARYYALALALLLGFTSASAQDVVPPPKPRVSPMAASQVMLDGGAYVRVIYGQPHRQDPRSETPKPRVIFGEVVPFGQLWRLGANEATMLVSTGALEVAGKTLPAGVYSLYAIPERDKWTLIINKSVGQWGTQYDEAQDVVRIDVPAAPSPEVYEAFTISFDKPSETDKASSNMNLMWEQTKVVVPIKAAGRAG